MNEAKENAKRLKGENAAMPTDLKYCFTSSVKSNTCFETCASSAKEKQELYNQATSSSVLQDNFGSPRFSITKTCEDQGFNVAMGNTGVQVNFRGVFSGVDKKNYEPLKWALG
jgi:hypothetical protein